MSSPARLAHPSLRALLVCGGALAASPASAASDDVPVPIALLGRLHFPLLHFPIVLLYAVLIVELFGGARLEPAARKHVSSVLLSIGAVLAVLTAIAGLAYAQGEDVGGAEASAFALHRALGLATAGIVVLLATLRRADDGGAASRAYRPLLVCGVVVATVTGHLGGELVHGDGFLTRPLRSPASAADARDDAAYDDRKDSRRDADNVSRDGGDDDGHVGDARSERVDAGRAATADEERGGPVEVRQRYPEGPVPETPDYARDIQPLFQRSCVKCHGPEKRKSGLRLDQKRYAMKGGENGPAIVPGDAMKSSVFTSCSAPPDDEDVMPPKGKLLALSEIETLKRWIDQGAAWPDEPTK